jgi:hypothetical protein
MKPVTPLAGSSFKAEGSVVAHFGSKATDGVVAAQFQWGEVDLHGVYPQPFTFSIRNQLSQAVTKVYCLVIFYDSEGKPVDTYEARLNEPVQPGLAKRLTGEVDKSVQNLSASYSGGWQTRVEFRVLDFEVVGASD